MQLRLSHFEHRNPNEPTEEAAIEDDGVNPFYQGESNAGGLPGPDNQRQQTWEYKEWNDGQWHRGEIYVGKYFGIIVDIPYFVVLLDLYEF